MIFSLDLSVNANKELASRTWTYLPLISCNVANRKMYHSFRLKRKVVIRLAFTHADTKQVLAAGVARKEDLRQSGMSVKNKYLRSSTLNWLYIWFIYSKEMQIVQLGLILFLTGR